jgi:hypothetical protein
MTINTARHHFFFTSFSPAPALNLKNIISPSSTTWFRPCCRYLPAAWNHRQIIISTRITEVLIVNTVELGYSNIGYCDTLSIASNIQWYELIPHKATVIFIPEFFWHVMLVTKFLIYIFENNKSYIQNEAHFRRVWWELNYSIENCNILTRFLRWLVAAAGFPPWRPGFYPRSGHVGFVVAEAALGYVFSEYFSFPRQF